MMSVLETIGSIISDEIKTSNYSLVTFDFAVNVTGGTNIIASGAILAATLIRIKAYYVLDSKMELKRKKYVQWFPIPPINIIRSLSKSQQKILQTLEKDEFVWKGEKQKGVMKNKDLEKKNRLRSFSLNSVIKKLPIQVKT